jgi:hypothetical protein
MCVENGRTPKMNTPIHRDQETCQAMNAAAAAAARRPAVLRRELMA